MHIRRLLPAALVMGLATARFATASAQYYYAPCSPFPLAWPFCAAGAVVGTAVDVATAPVWLLSGAPPPFSYRPAYYAPAYYYPPPPPPYYYGPR